MIFGSKRFKDTTSASTLALKLKSIRSEYLSIASILYEFDLNFIGHFQ